MIRHVITYLLGSVVFRATSIVLLPVLTRMLTPKEYGVLELLNRATDFLLLCLFLNGNSLATITLYNQAHEPQEKRKIAGTALLYGAVCVGIVGGCAQGLAGWIGSYLGVPSTTLVRLAFLGALFESFVTICLALAQARAESFFYSAITVAQLILRVSLITAFLCLANWGVEGVLVASIITSFLSSGFLLAREWRRSPGFDRSSLYEMAAFALPFLPGGFCALLSGTGDQFFLVRYTDTAEIGLYALGYKLAMLVTAFTRDPFYRVWAARMHVAAAGEDAPRVFGLVYTRLTAAYLFVGLGLVLLGDEVIGLLSGPRYAGATAYLPPITLAYLFLAGSDLMDAAFFIRRRTSVKLWINVISTAVILALYLLLIPRYKAAGAAYATLLGFLFRNALTYAVSQRLFFVRYEWDRVVVLVASAVAFWAGSQLLPAARWTPAVKLLMWLSWPAMLWIASVVSDEEKAAFRAALLRARDLVLSTSARTALERANTP